MKKRWKVEPPVADEIRNRFPELHPVALQLLYNRGLQTQAAIDEFFNPDYSQDLHDPFLFVDMERAVQRIFKALNKNEKVVVHGDYDSDGVCSSVLLVSLLKALGIDCEVYLPHREKEGYGLNTNTISYLKEQNVALIITVDCGISNVKEIAEAQEQGIDVIITDHHAEPPQLPAAYAILNPKLKHERYPYSHLAGVGVAFKLAQAVVARDAQKILPVGYEKWLMDLAAIATITDMMPLIGENRTIVKYGLMVINKQRRPGLKLLLTRAGVLDPAVRSSIDAERIGFTIGPRINAAGRMEHANTAFNLLMSTDELEGIPLVEELEANNLARQQRTKQIIEEALLQVDEDAPVSIAVGDEWEMGVVGLVASRVKDVFNKPTFIITRAQGKLTGSGRSIPEFDVIEALHTLKHVFTHYGGHKAACGFSFADEGALLEFRKEITRLADAALLGKDTSPFLSIDAELDVADIGWEVYNVIMSFEPFGMGNRKPLFVIRNLEIEGVRAVGTDAQHLKCIFRHPAKMTALQGIAFGLGNRMHELAIGKRLDVVAYLDANVWNGRKELQLKIQDFTVV